MEPKSEQAFENLSKAKFLTFFVLIRLKFAIDPLFFGFLRLNLHLHLHLRHHLLFLLLQVFVDFLKIQP